MSTAGSHGMQNPGYAKSNRSLAKSNRSIASTRTTKTQKSVQSEYENYRTQQKVNALGFSFHGSAKRPIYCSIGFIIAGVLLLIVGLTMMGLWLDGRLHLSYKAEFICFLFIILAILCGGVAAKFCWEAKKASDKERGQVRYKADGSSQIKIVDKQKVKAQDNKSLKSGSYSHKAIGTPNTTMNSISGSMVDRPSVDKSFTSKRSQRSLPSLDRSDDEDEVQNDPGRNHKY